MAVPPRAASPDVLNLPGRALPGWTEPFLDPPGAGEFFATRLWFDTLLAHALPEGAEPLLAWDPARCALLPLVRQGARLGSLAGPYSLAWRPLFAPGTDMPATHAAGRALARLVRGGRPMTFELLDPASPGMAEFVAGLRSGRALAGAFDHVGNWYEMMDQGTTWSGYLAARPPTLRTTISRKLARAERTHRFAPVAAPGAELDEAIAAYEDVRARSWKPEEPFPRFDDALLRATAAAGLLRLGVLWEREGGRAIAAQYWVLDHARDPGDGAALPRATVLKLSHDEAARAASPGTVLTALMIRRLIEEDGVRILDFGRGDDPYKQLWAGTRRQRIGLVIADPFSPLGFAALARQWAGPLVRRFRAKPGA